MNLNRIGIIIGILGLLVSISILTQSCGGLKMNVGDYLNLDKTGDSGAVFFNDEDEDINPDGTLKSDITTFATVEIQPTQPPTDQIEILKAFFEMSLGIVKEHAGVYKAIWGIKVEGTPVE